MVRATITELSLDFSVIPVQASALFAPIRRQEPRLV